MAKASWHLDRRTFLMGTGVTLGLPWLECMGSQQENVDTPRRMGAFYFGFGVSLPKEKSEQAKWRWFPNGAGRDYQLTETLKPLDSQRENLTVLGGLSHPNGRKMGGHDTGDTFLTGAYMHNKFSPQHGFRRSDRGANLCRPDAVSISGDVDGRWCRRTHTVQHALVQRQRSAAAGTESTATDFRSLLWRRRRRLDRGPPAAQKRLGNARPRA